MSDQEKVTGIHVIGCGGIGSNFIYNIWRDRFVYRDHPIMLSLYDADDVEPKNLIRQNFTQRCIGKNKAIALSERYGDDLDIEANPKFFNPNQIVAGEMTMMDMILDEDIIVIGVDNIKSRLDIYTTVYERLVATQSAPIIIDAGNHYDSGNVYVITSIDALRVGIDVYTALYEQEEDGRAPYEILCGEIVDKNDDGFEQIYTTNMFAALYASMFVRKIVTDNSESYINLWNTYYCGVKFGTTATLVTVQDFAETIELAIKENS